MYLIYREGATVRGYAGPLQRSHERGRVRLIHRQRTLRAQVQSHYRLVIEIPSPHTPLRC